MLPPPVLLARDLVAEGYRYSDLTTLARSEQLHHLRRGAYTRAVVDLDEAGRHRQLVAATIPLLVGSVVSHLSAAALHQLPLPTGLLRQVQVTRPQATSGQRRGYVHRFAAPLAADEVTVAAGVPVTSLARTVVDLGRTLPFAGAVSAADAALRRGLTPAELDLAIKQASGRPGVAAARRMAAFADARSESPGESNTRVVFDDRGREVARCNFGWDEHRTVGEFDGLVKYARLLRPGQTAAEVVYAEKRREDAVRDAGWQVVR